MSTTIGPLLLITVSMATNYGDEYSLESYRNCLSKLHALILIADPDAVHTIIAGDFNCSSNSRFLESFVILLETINWLYLIWPALMVFAPTLVMTVLIRLGLIIFKQLFC